jgi:outer membrane protein assembly factor BamB
VWGLVCLTCSTSRDVSAGDWPQILGPQRNGVAAPDERLLDAWPAEGPAVVWERPVGEGFSGIAIAGERGIVFHRLGDQETIEAFDTATGRAVWKDSHPTTFRAQVGEGSGPLATPTIQDGKVVTYGAQGVLTCHDLTTGKRLWRRNTHADFEAREGYFGAGSSPLVDGDLVIVNVGGFRSNAAVVAFDLATGRTVWQAFNDHASYSSPVVATVKDRRHLLVVTRLHCLALDPANGAMLFQFPYGDRGPTVNAANPLVLGDRLFLTASYGIGAVWAKIEPAASEFWRSDDVYSSQYCTPVEHEGLLYGVDGRQDIPPAELKCFDPAARRVLWSQPGIDYGSVLKADGKLLVATTNGELVLAALDPQQYRPLARARMMTGTTRALPALAQGRLYLRNEDTLKCFQVGPTSQPETRP